MFKKRKFKPNGSTVLKRLYDFQVTPAEFYAMCGKARLSKRDTELAYKYFIEHYTPKEVWLWLCSNKEYAYLEWDSVYQLLWRIGKKLDSVEDL